MFTTFPILSTASSRPNSNPSSASPTTTQPPRPRQKRSQVTRACDWCRTHRVKCDDNYPCLNCQSRGSQCSNDRTNGIRTLPHAFREIERLRQRQKELQDELEEERSRNGNQNAPLVVPPSSQSLRNSNSSGLPYSLDPAADGEYPSPRYWEGVYIRTAGSPAKTWYGPSSLIYFMSRLTTFWDRKVEEYHLENYEKPEAITKPFDEHFNSPGKQVPNGGSWEPPSDLFGTKEHLSPTQEEYFLDLYWQSYHSSLPVLNEDDFKQHYKSLWAERKKNRKPSALVDIVIAICMQYGLARARGNTATLKFTNVDVNDVALAGRWYYCRCQTILAYELENPTISTLQCNLLSVTWLCCASLQNIADNTLAVTARTAQRLGLHLPPPQDIPSCEKELRKRLWWSIYVLETKISMRLGRPFLLHPSHISCGLPGDDHEAAALSGSNFAPLGDYTTWLSWNLHNTKLLLTVRNVYTEFYNKYPSIFNGNHDQTIYDVPNTLETYAGFLIAQMKTVEDWVKEIPDVLKARRQNHGSPFSTDRSPLEIEQFAPFWVQHQRLLLELLYHNLCTNLYRPFISFKPTSTSLSILSLASSESFPSAVERCAHNCADHAMAATHIMHQVLTTTDILAGWHEAFQWQWNCSITLIGFVLAYPSGELTQAARKSIEASLEVLEAFGHSYAIAESAVGIVRGFSETLNHIVETNMTRADLPVPGTTIGSTGLNKVLVNDMRELLAGSMEMAFAIDGYNNSNMWWPGKDPTEYSVY